MYKAPKMAGAASANKDNSIDGVDVIVDAIIVKGRRGFTTYGRLALWYEAPLRVLCCSLTVIGSQCRSHWACGRSGVQYGAGESG